MIKGIRGLRHQDSSHLETIAEEEPREPSRFPCFSYFRRSRTGGMAEQATKPDLADRISSLAIDKI